jgi:hypothetical protein
MDIISKIVALAPGLPPAQGEDLEQMTEDIYHYFSELEDFEVLRVEQTSAPDRMVVAAVQTTMQDPFFKIVVTHTWQSDLAFDDQWCSFEEQEGMTLFRFLTWDDDAYIAGEIWFERAKKELV